MFCILNLFVNAFVMKSENKREQKYNQGNVKRMHEYEIWTIPAGTVEPLFSLQQGVKFVLNQPRE